MSAMANWGQGGIFKRGAGWWIRYAQDGRQVKESTSSTDRKMAQALLTLRLGEIRAGKVPGGLAARITLAELAELGIAEYKANKRKSVKHLELHWRHLLNYFGETTRAITITTDRLIRFTADMQARGYANATVNLRLASLARAFSLMVKAKRLSRDQVPDFPYLEVRNARQGFFERADFENILQHITEPVRPVLEVAYLTGWRMRSELFTRQWRHVDFGAGWLRLDPGETKNGEGRDFPLIPELRAILERQRAYTDEVQRRTGRVVPWVFHRDGRRIITIQRDWKRACELAGVPFVVVDTPDVKRQYKDGKPFVASGRKLTPALIPHDFRRTAVRNLELASVPRSVAMKMVGHKTTAMYTRYAIVDSKALNIGGDRLSEYLRRPPHFE